jgi:hypothetical protein
VCHWLKKTLRLVVSSLFSPTEGPLIEIAGSSESLPKAFALLLSHNAHPMLNKAITPSGTPTAIPTTVVSCVFLASGVELDEVKDADVEEEEDPRVEVVLVWAMVPVMLSCWIGPICNLNTALEFAQFVSTPHPQ